MARYHAIMKDECGDEYGVAVVASSRAAAYDKLREDYAESRCVQLDSAYDIACRERRQYRAAQRAYDNGY